MIRLRICPTSAKAADGRYVIQVVEPTPPVKVPEDAIILPYDPDSTTASRTPNRVLVPYRRYVELWNRAHPDKKIETKAAPAPYALAGASYKTLLEGDEYLLVTGQMEIDVFSDGFVQIPLGLGGGVLAQAELDGKPARLSAVSRRGGCETAGGCSSVVLYVSGKGRHKLDLSVRLKLVRQGGWRIAEGVLPAAPASSLVDRRAEAADRASAGPGGRPPEIRHREAGRNDPHGLGRRRRAGHCVAAGGGRGPGRPQPDGRIRRRVRRAGGRPAARVAAWARISPRPARAVHA